MGRVVRSALVALVLAAVVAPVARADVLDVGQETESTTVFEGTCAWWEEATATGWVSVDACGYDDPQTGESWIGASRVWCEDAGERTDCHGTWYERAAAPDEVVIDADAGIARLAATIDDCSLDVTITGDGESYDYSGRWGYGMPRFREGRLELRNQGYNDSFEYGSAAGDVCTWTEPSAVDGRGFIERWRDESDTTYARPDYELLSPVVSTEHGQRERPIYRAACGYWWEETADTYVDVESCGYLYGEGDGDAELLAWRYECNRVGGFWECTGERHHEPDPPAGAVTVDMEAGTGRLLGVAGSCGIDMTIAGGDRYTYTGGDGPPMAEVDGGVTVFQSQGHYESRYGTASGEVCGLAGTGYGGLWSKSYVDHYTTFRPAAGA